MAKKNTYIVVQRSLTSGHQRDFVVKSSTPRGASMIVNRDHYNRFSINKVYSVVQGKPNALLFETKNMS